MTSSTKIARLPIDRALFLERLRSHGCVRAAARETCPWSADGNYSHFYSLRRTDPTFAAQWEEALETARDAIMRTAVSRAVEGTRQRVYQKGSQVFNADGTPAEITVYSDNVLIALMKIASPELRERHVHHSGEINHRVGSSAATITLDDLRAIEAHDPEQAKALIQALRLISKLRKAEPMALALPCPADAHDAEYVEVPEDF